MRASRLKPLLRRPHRASRPLPQPRPIARLDVRRCSLRSRAARRGVRRTPTDH